MVSRATNLSVFLYADSNHLSKVFKMTVAPNLSERLSNKILKDINSKITINLFAQIGSIASFRLEKQKFLSGLHQLQLTVTEPTLTKFH